MNDFIKLTPEEEKARKRRSVWIALALVAFIVLVFVVSVAQMQAHTPSAGDLP